MPKYRKPQVIQFIHKEMLPAPEGEKQVSHTLQTVADGTTNEEVIGVLIDRLRFLDAKLPSHETALAIIKMEEALMWLQARTANRQVRGVEGTHQP